MNNAIPSTPTPTSRRSSSYRGRHRTAAGGPRHAAARTGHSLGVPTLAAAGSATLVLAALTAAPASALGKIKCDSDGEPTVAVGSFDPIVNHNGQGSMHEHQFFGNESWLTLDNPNTANYKDLAGKVNNCRPAMGLATSPDSAGYWSPTLRYVSGPHKGEIVPVRQFTSYYRSFASKQFGAGLPFPADTRLVATDDQGPGLNGWTCGAHSVQAQREGPRNSIPDCTGESGKAGHTLTAHISFPSCWDGVGPKHTTGEVGDTQDTAHYTYPTRKTCPASHPIRMVQLRETIQFSYVGNGSDVRLASDKPGMANGESMHADFWNTWNQPEFVRFVATCVNGTGDYAVKSCDP